MTDSLDNTQVYWTWRMLMERSRVEWPEPDFAVQCVCGTEMLALVGEWRCPNCGMSFKEQDQEE